MISISESKTQWLKEKIRDVPDFPKPGIVFKDLSTLFKDPEGFTYIVDALSDEAKKLKPEKIVGIEARGFIVGAAVAYKLGLGFIPIRKPGKLPYEKESLSYDLEYGKDTIEIHIDAVAKNEKVVLIDDLLATGGTAAAACKLLQKIGAELAGTGFVVTLEFLNGKSALPKVIPFFSLVSF